MKHRNHFKHIHISKTTKYINVCLHNWIYNKFICQIILSEGAPGVKNLENKRSGKDQKENCRYYLNCSNFMNVSGVIFNNATCINYLTKNAVYDLTIKCNDLPSWAYNRRIKFIPVNSFVLFLWLDYFFLKN